MLVEVSLENPEEMDVKRETLDEKQTREGASDSDVSRFPSPDFIRFSVIDTGIGIPEDVQSRLFQAFSQADVSTTRKYGGTGLGLAISRQLVELMEGVVGVDTTVGGGATFWCRIPMVYEPDDHQKMTTSVQVSQARILCVGCPTATSVALQGLLEELSVRWEATDDCAKAHVWLREGASDGQGYSIVLVDDGIPEPYQQTFLQAVKADPILDSLRVVLLTKMGAGVLGQREQRGEIDESLNKPLRRISLLRCLQGQSRADQNRQEASHDERLLYSDISAHQSHQVSTKDPILHGPKVLVAEDNAVNQKVVSWALKKLGCVVTLVENGQMALNVSSTEHYDLIFMDWQMPVMDGLETTRAIRQREAQGKNRETNDEKRDTFHVPIIGMTANAMKGDKEQCLEAGMDDYVSKPVRAQELRVLLSKWAPDFFQDESSSFEVSPIVPNHSSAQDEATGSQSENAEDVSSPNAVPKVYDLELALQELEGDEVLLHSLIEIFLQTGPQLMHAIREAFDARDYSELEKQAHQLKGSSGSLQAHEVSRVSARVEKAARTKDDDVLRNAFSELDDEFTKLHPVLQAIATQGIGASRESYHSVLST